MADDAVEPERHQPAQWELAAPALARHPVVRDAGLVGGERRDHAAHVRMQVLDGPEVIEDAAVDQPEIAGVAGDLLLRDVVQQRVEAAAKKYQDEAFLPAPAQ